MRRPSDDREEHDAEALETELRPSKSARKRAALAAQKLGEELTCLKATELEALHLPDELREAILEAQRIRSSRGGLARQRQYIGKLMREIELEPLERALAMRRKSGVLPS